MKVQHAPSPVHAARVIPEIVACVTAQRNSGGRLSRASSRTMPVRMPLNTELNRFRRAQSIALGGRPPARRGNDRPLRWLALSGDEAAHRPTSATRRLYQFMNAETMRLMERNTPIRRAMSSISQFDCIIAVPAKNLVQFRICHRRAERGGLDDVEGPGW